MVGLTFILRTFVRRNDLVAKTRYSNSSNRAICSSVDLFVPKMAAGYESAVKISITIAF